MLDHVRVINFRIIIIIIIIIITDRIQKQQTCCSTLHTGTIALLEWFMDFSYHERTPIAIVKQKVISAAAQPDGAANSTT